MHAIALQELVDQIVESWPMNGEKYPHLNNKSTDAFRVEAARHCLLHLMDTMGRLAGSIEPYEHGDHPREYPMKKTIVKLTIEVLRLAEVSGFSAQTLLEACFEKLLLTKNKSKSQD